MQGIYRIANLFKLVSLNLGFCTKYFSQTTKLVLEPNSEFIMFDAL
jgi:hypothetical protein